MDIKKKEKNSKLITYKIPNYILNKKILEIKSKLNEQFNFFKTGSKSYVNGNIINVENNSSLRLFYQGDNMKKQKSMLLQNSNSINNKQIPPLLKNVINPKKSNKNININKDKFNSEKNISNKLIKSISFNLINNSKNINKRPSSSYSNNNIFSSTNQKIYKSLINKKNKAIFSEKSRNRDMRDLNNRPMSSTMKATKINIFDNSSKNKNENQEEYKADKDNENKKYYIKFKNKSEIFGEGNLRYSSNKNNIKKNLTPSSLKFNSIKSNNNNIKGKNKINFSKIKSNSSNYNSIDIKNKYIRKYFFDKDCKTKSLDYINDNKKERETDLILYRTIFYSNKKRNIDTFDRKKYYNDLIRARNEQNKKITLAKRYSFYKYKEYMNQIEKEELEEYKKEKERKDLINIQEIFCDISSRKNSLKVKNENQNKNIESLKKKNSNKEFQIFHINYNDNIIIEEENISISENNNKKKKGVSKKSSTNKKKKLTRKKKEKDKIKEEDISYTQSDIIIDNFETDKYKKEKELIKEKKEYINEKERIINAKANKIRLDKRRNSFKNSKNELKKIFCVEIDKKPERKKTDPDNPPPDNKEGYITEILENNINNNEFDISNLLSIKNKQRAKNYKLIDIVKDNYLKARAEIRKRNKNNLESQKLLLQKIREAEKNIEKKRQSQSNPFFYLKFKYMEDKNINKYKEQKLINKYIKRNESKKKFLVRLKSRNSLTIYSNNNSLNSSMNDIMEQYNELRNLNKQYGDYKEESINQNNIDNENSNIIKDSNIFNIDGISNIYKRKEDNNNSDKLLNNDKESDDDESSNNKEILLLSKYDNILKKKEGHNIIIEKKNLYDEKIVEFTKQFIEKYYNKNIQNNDTITDEMYEEINFCFLNLIKENDDLIKSSQKKEQMELFLEFKEKMDSLQKFSKKDFNLYILKNYEIILKILQECKRDKQKEIRINEFLKALNNDLNMLYKYKDDISYHMKLINYQPFFSYFQKSV